MENNEYAGTCYDGQAGVVLDVLSEDRRSKRLGTGRQLLCPGQWWIEGMVNGQWHWLEIGGDSRMAVVMPLAAVLVLVLLGVLMVTLLVQLMLGVMVLVSNGVAVLLAAQGHKGLRCRKLGLHSHDHQ